MNKKSFIYFSLFVILVINSLDLYCQIGNALYFQNNTFNSHGDFVYCGQPNYNFTDKITVTAWIKWTIDPTNWAVQNHEEREGYYATYIAYATHNTLNINNEHGQFWLRNTKTGNKIQFTVENASGIKATATSTLNPTANTWYFIAGVYDGSKVKLYINGQLQGEANLTGNIRSNADCRLNMGRLPWGYGFFVGYMDEVRIWNIALSQSEIQNQMITTSTIQDNYCQSYWSFNETSGTTVTDAKGKANGVFYTALIDVHLESDFPNKKITDTDRAFITGAWNGKTLYTVAGAGVDETNVIINNIGNNFYLEYGFGGTAPDDRATPVIDGNANMTWLGVLDPIETSQWVASDIPLPVELVSFTAKFENQKIILKWKTATEVNNYGFEIERKIINKETKENDWQKIGFIKGKGVTNAVVEYSFIDENIISGKLKYRLKQIDNDGSFKYSDEIEIEVNMPREFILYQNYPNPFNPTTKIKFSLVQDGLTTLKIYDILGREVQMLVNEELKAGQIYEVIFDASKLSPGIYFYKLENNNNSSTKKLILIK